MLACVPFTDHSGAAHLVECALNAFRSAFAGRSKLLEPIVCVGEAPATFGALEALVGDRTPQCVTGDRKQVAACQPFDGFLVRRVQSEKENKRNRRRCSKTCRKAVKTAESRGRFSMQE